MRGHAGHGRRVSCHNAKTGRLCYVERFLWIFASCPTSSPWPRRASSRARRCACPWPSPRSARRCAGSSASSARICFHRDQRSVTLTAAGEALLPHARAALAAADRARDSIASLRGMLHGRLRVGVSRPVDHRLAETLGEFHRNHPAIEITLTEQHNEPLLQAVAGGDLDAALVGMPGAQALPPQVSTRVISVEPLVVAVPPGHPLARRRSVALGALREEPIITLMRGSGLRARARAGRAARPASRPVSPPRPASSAHLSSSSPRDSAWRSFPARPPGAMSRSSGSCGRACTGAPRWRGTRSRPRRQGAPSSRSPSGAFPARSRVGLDRRG